MSRAGHHQSNGNTTLKLSSNADGCCESKTLQGYINILYNSVPYTIIDIYAIEYYTIWEQLHHCEYINYVISQHNIVNAMSLQVYDRPFSS